MKKQNLKIILSILINVFFCATLIAQTKTFFSTENGLSNSLINQIYQDKKGYIWIATEYGLNKFDGINFTTYKHIEGDSTSLRHNYIRTVFQSSAGVFYIGTMEGLMEYDSATDSFQNIELIRDNKTVYPHISSIIETKNGDVWLSTSGQGVFYSKKGSKKFIYQSKLTLELNSIYLNFIFEDSQSRIWIGSESDGLNMYDPKTRAIKSFKAPHAINSNNISAISEDSQGNIYVGTLTKGLSKLDTTEQKFHSIKHHSNPQLFIKSIQIDDKDRLYIGTDGQGLMLYNSVDNVIEDYKLNSVPFDLTKGKVHSILFDKDKNIWLGFFQKGLFLIPVSENKFEYFGYKSIENNIIGSSSITAIHKDNEGIIWIGTDNDGIYGITDNKRSTYHFKKTTNPNSIPNIIHSIYEDSTGNIWLGSYTDGLAKFNKKTGECHYIQYFSDKKVYFITENNRGELLIGTFGSGVYILDKKGDIIDHFESSKQEMDILSIDELFNDWINTIMCDKEGLIWIGHFKGLSCYNPIEKTFLTFFKRNNILPGTVVQALLEDKKGKIWIGTTSGLYCFNKETHKLMQFTTQNGLPNNVICGICEDKEENLWISTYNGISKFKIKENRFVNYFATDGLQGNEFTKGAVYQDNQGKIYFGGINGVTSFFPHEIIEQKKELNITLTNFYIYNRAIKKGSKSNRHEILSSSSVSETEKFTLNYTDNTFSFEFSTFEFSNPERISYWYKIENLDSEWLNTMNGANRITYNNLPPGKYKLKVRAYENSNYSPIKTYYIKIIPPWYRSIWAYIIYSILFLLIIYGIINYIISRIHYRQELIEKEHEKEISEAKLQFFINISHEIRTPMTLIINPLEKLIKENKNQEKQKTYLMIYRNAQRILRLINQLMDIRKLDKGQMSLKCRETNIVGFIEDLMLTFEYEAKRKNIDFSFEPIHKSLMVWIDLNNFDKVLMNILSNAFKYTQKNGEIRITLTTSENKQMGEYFEISVIDSGIGIDKNQIENIFERFYQIKNDKTNSNFGTGIGLHLARLLVEMHSGILFAENRKDTQGSRFIIRLPLGNKHLKPDEFETPQQNIHSAILQKRTDRLEVANILNEENILPDSEKKAKTKYRILIVEDEEEIRQYIKDEISGDYKVKEAKDGKKALEILLKEKPDLVISDIMMPEMDGIDLCKKIKQNININHIPIILLTAKVQVEDKVEGLEIGADAYLTKPFNSEILKQTIQNLIANRQRLQSSFSGSQHQNDKIEKIELKSADEIFIEKVMKVINDNLSNPDLNVEMLAENVGMSRVHMHRKLKELTNQSARDFIRGIRLKQAATLLTSNKKLYVSEVAYATGFSNLSHFSNSFKEFYGMSPTEYINKQNHKKE